MKIYYVGCLYPNCSSDKSKYVAKFEKDYYYCSDLNYFNLGIEARECNYLKENLIDYSGVMSGIGDKKIIEILNKAYKGLSRLLDYKEKIIYEIIVSKSG